MLTRLPEGAWDCHAHVIEDPRRYPLSSGRSYEPPAAPLEAYLAMLDHLGLAHGVLVQPSIYDFDNRCLLDALDRAERRLFGVAVPPPSATPRELEAMHRRGVRGVRCNRVNPGGLEPEAVIAWQSVLKALGWHVELHIEVARIGDLRAYLARFQLPIVIDHMGRPAPGRVDPHQPALHQLVSLVREGACFVKLSAPYRLLNEPPPWRGVTPLARALLEANPRACVWASDWPHTQMREAIDADDLLDALDDWCPDPERKRTVLAETPTALYGSAAGGTVFRK